MVVRFYDDKHVEVADGLLRKVNRTKRKNVKHLLVHQAKLEQGRLMIKPFAPS